MLRDFSATHIVVMFLSLALFVATIWATISVVRFSVMSVPTKVIWVIVLWVAPPLGVLAFGLDALFRLHRRPAMPKG
ncbi:hypothetical protein [Frondihabitans australicus]|uniref:Phospholipase D-like protein n=1 Tax=Frondihabitans australicus TaxID=386892 RepID=A0A495ICX9_9MICO|nr:hypothetical protein [Frondihabitans australicus]RKR73480.1 phospholipase D-like protein [Frondihabitans australicus]